MFFMGQTRSLSRCTAYNYGIGTVLDLILYLLSEFIVINLSVSQKGCTYCYRRFFRGSPEYNYPVKRLLIDEYGNNNDHRTVQLQRIL